MEHARHPQVLLQRFRLGVFPTIYLPRYAEVVLEDIYGFVQILAGRILGQKESLCQRAQQAIWQVLLHYLNLHLTHRGALWASGAAQAGHVVRIILVW